MIPRQILLVARGVWLEAIRRREIYVIVTLCCLLILGLAQVRFFGLSALDKFYREIALKVMGVASALTVIVLAARQLPREFEQRTIYPLLARPLRRGTFMLGKLLGVLGAGAFCQALFLGIFVLGCAMLGAPIPWSLLFQYAWLQGVMLLVMASLCFLLSIVVNLDAAITFGLLFYVASSTFSTMMSYLYETADRFGQAAIHALTWLLPQFMLFDLSEKAVHGEMWKPIDAGTVVQLTLYGLVFATVYFLASLALFRRRAL